MYRMTSKQFFACFLASALVLGKSALAAPQAKVEDCGWLVSNGSAAPEPDALLKPSHPRPCPLRHSKPKQPTASAIP